MALVRTRGEPPRFFNRRAGRCRWLGHSTLWKGLPQLSLGELLV